MSALRRSGRLAASAICFAGVNDGRRSTERHERIRLPGFFMALPDDDAMLAGMNYADRMLVQKHKVAECYPRDVLAQINGPQIHVVLDLERAAGGPCGTGG